MLANQDLKSENSALEVNRYEIVRYIIKTLNPTIDKTILDNLTDKDAWDDYKKTLPSDLRENNEEIDQIDELIKDTRRQEFYLAIKESYKNENYSEYNETRNEIYLLQKNLEEEKLSHGDAKEILKKIKLKEEKANELFNKLAKTDPYFLELQQTINHLRAALSPHHTEEHGIFKYVLESKSHSIEIATCVDETIELANEQYHFLHTINEIEKPEVDPIEPVHHGGAETEALTPLGVFLKSVPLVNDFLRGLTYLHDAKVAYDNPDTPQRRTKMGAGIFGGLVSIGVGIVGSLLLAGTGLLGTAAAITFAPIVLGASVLGIYGVTLYRDSYILHQARLQAEETQKWLDKTTRQLDHETELVVSRFLNKNKLELKTSKECEEILKLQQTINDKRTLVNSEDTDKNALPGLLAEIKVAIKQRNDLINQASPHFKNKIHNELCENPRIARLTNEKSNLTVSLNRLETARAKAQRNVILSTICVVGFGLALGALFATGVGAIVISAAASAVVIGATVKRLWDHYKIRKEHKAHAAHAHAAAHAEEKPSVEHAHSQSHGPTKNSNHEVTKLLESEKHPGSFVDPKASSANPAIDNDLVTHSSSVNPKNGKIEEPEQKKEMETKSTIKSEANDNEQPTKFGLG